MHFVLQGQVSEDNVMPVDVQGRPHGTWIEFHDNGVVRSVSQYNRGLKEGYVLSFSNKGNLLSRNEYSRDTFEWSAVFLSAGRKIEEAANFENGCTRWSSAEIWNQWKNARERKLCVRKKDGVFMWYYTNGKVASEYIYVLGSIEGKVAFFHEEGGMKSSTIYQGNKRNGAYLEYDKENRIVVKEAMWMTQER